VKSCVFFDVQAPLLCQFGPPVLTAENQKEGAIMSRKRNRIDPNQMTLDLRWERKVTHLVSETRQIHDAMAARPATRAENDFEACIAVAAAAKRAIDQSGLSRDNVVDRINRYFRRTDDGARTDPPGCFKPLSKHMMDKYLSQPIEYKLPAYLLYALHYVTGSLEPARMLVEAEGGAVVTAVEKRRLHLVQLQDYMGEAKRLEGELKKSMRVV
jgi:hypothetical protein